MVADDPAETARRQRPGPAGRRRGRPAGAHQPRTGWPGASRWSTRPPPTSTPRSTLAADVTIFPGAILQGRTDIGQGVEIGPGCRLVDCTVGEHTTLEHTVGHHSEIGADCEVGPYAVLEAGSRIPSGTRTGPFYTAGTAAGLDD